MAFRPRSWLNRKLRQRAQDQWALLGDGETRLPPSGLRSLRAEAVQLRQSLDRFLRGSDHRIDASRADLDRIPLPGGTDWRWRPAFLTMPLAPAGVAGPENGAPLADGVAIWHDCGQRALLLRQVQNALATDLAAFGLQIEVLGFSGSFLSLAIDLPPSLLAGLTRNHIIRVETILQPEAEIGIYLRLNVGNGPNTEQIVRHVGDIGAGAAKRCLAEFDLAMTEMNEKRLDKIWLDLIIEKPHMNALIIREMILSRHPRANV